MPELPEVEVVRRDLEREIVGKRVKAVDADGMRSIRRHHNRKQFANRLVGKKITGIERRGKYILAKLDGGDVLVSTFGEMFVTELDGVEKEVAELSHLGIDPLEDAMSWDNFGRLVASKHMKLKSLLMDQKFLAGIGNIYSDEILFGAGLRWDRMSDSLSGEEIRRLYRSMVETLQEAVKHRGSSLADEQYVDLNGKPGEYQLHHKVYAREGEACRRCRQPIVRQRIGGRSTFFCEACQV